MSIDETKSFLDCRYVSPPEAVWRLHERSLYNRSHTIERLPVHLPEEQLVYVSVENEDFSVIDKDTKLTGYFKLCREDENARQFLYSKIPEHYVWNKNLWKPRKRLTKCIGHIFTVNPLDQERYFLRILIYHVKGAQSYEFLKTVDGKVWPTFRDAAYQLHLLDDDNDRMGGDVFERHYWSDIH